MNLKTLSIVALAATVYACQPGSTSSFQGTLNTTEDSLSYALGVNIGSNLKAQEMDSLNLDAMSAAMERTLAGDSNLLMTNEEAGQFLNTYFQALNAKRMEKEAQEREQAGAAARGEGEKFLAENGQREGVTTTASGLQYEVISEGSGAKPTAEDRVKVHYRGTLLNGEEFDSSYSRNQPAVFGLNQVISGWTEGLQLMPVGAKYKFYIPFELAYGERGGGSIPPYSMLTFEVELLEINPQE